MSQKLSFEHVQGAIKAGGDMLVSKTYDGCHQPLLVLCSRCNGTYPTTYRRYMSGARCFGCAHKAARLKLRKYNIDFVRDFIKKAGEELISTEYIDTKTKIKILCHKCNGTYNIRFDNYKRGSRCNLCCQNVKHKYDDVREYVASFGDTLMSTEYYTITALMKFKCGNCTDIFETTLTQYRLGNGCLKCFGQKRYTQGEVAKIVLDGGDTLISQYVRFTNKIEIQCSRCKNNYSTLLGNYLKGRRCRACGLLVKAGKRRLKFADVKKYIEGCGETLLSDVYTSSKLPLKIRCNKCKGEYERTYSTFKYHNSRCDTCYGKQSKGETRVETCLTSLGLHFKAEKRFVDCKCKIPLPFDFYVFSTDSLKKEIDIQRHFCIEYQGEQHYKAIGIYGGEEGYKKCIVNDNIKKDYCAKVKIPLLVIPYWDFDRIDKLIEEFILEINKTANTVINPVQQCTANIGDNTNNIDGDDSDTDSDSDTSSDAIADKAQA